MIDDESGDEEQRLQREQQYEQQCRQRDFEERKWKEDRAYKESTAVQIKNVSKHYRNRG